MQWIKNTTKWMYHMCNVMGFHYFPLYFMVAGSSHNHAPAHCVPGGEVQVTQ